MSSDPLARRPPLAGRLGTVFTALALCLVPWTAYLAIELPERAVARHYDLAWTGFDIALVLLLGGTAWTAHHRSRYFALTATATATMLVVDAWFDVVTSAPGVEQLVAVVLALLVEVPLALLCAWWALHAQDVLTERVAFLGRRASAVGGHVGEQAAD